MFSVGHGVSGLGHAIQAGVWAAAVKRVHHIVADGEFGPFVLVCFLNLISQISLSIRKMTEMLVI